MLAHMQKSSTEKAHIQKKDPTAGKAVNPTRSFFSMPRSPCLTVNQELSMPCDLLAAMGESYHTDFCHMRFYESPSLPSIHAQALTQGNKVFFAPGRFSPGSQAGRRLIGHELSHARTQSLGIGAGNGILYHSGLESQADHEGMLAAQGLPVSQASPTTAGLRANAPAQGYFTLLPNDYTLQSDQKKAAFTTHTYRNIGSMDPEKGELAEYSKEFTAPPKKRGSMMTVRTEDPAGNSAEFQALKQSDRQDLTDRRLREIRMGAHRQIADGYARTLGSARPAFQMQLSQNPALPKKQRERYAAVGVHRYSGKVALYVSDSADFAVNAQTPEPKEAYMTPAGVALSNGKRAKRVQLKLFPGNQITIPRPSVGGKVTLQMVRPYFTRDYQKGGSYDCGCFAELVGTTFSRERQESKPMELAVRRLDVWQTMKRAGMIGWFSWLFGQSGPMEKLETMQGFQQKVQTGLLGSRESIYGAGDLLELLDEEARAHVATRRFTAVGYQATGEEIESDRWENVRQPGKMETILQELRGETLKSVQIELSRQYFSARKQELSRFVMGDIASGKAPADDIRRIAGEAETYGADDGEMGINAGASPVLGQAYKIITALGDGWAYHWGAVVAACATDTLTLENYHKASELRALQLEFAKEQQALRAKGLAQHTLDQRMQALETRQNQKKLFYDQELLKTWYFNIQGTKKPGQSFHEKQASTGAYGDSSFTLVK